jgi:hypothetical protein
MIEEKIMQEYERVTNDVGAKAFSSQQIQPFGAHPRHD